MFEVARRLPGVPLVIRLHGEPYTFTKYTPGAKLTSGFRLCRRFQRYALRRARLLISPSRAHAREIGQELGRGHPPIEVIPNALASEMVARKSEIPSPNSEPEQFSSNGEARSLTLAPDASARGPRILYVGRLERGKGIPTLLRAAAEVLEAVPGARLLLAGSEHPSLPRSELDKLLEQVPGKDRIHRLGHVPWRDLFGWYEKAAVCVLPSYYETFGLAALEPMAFGVPVVATTAGGLPEVVQNHITGLLVPPGDERALAAALLHILKDRDFGRRLGENGRRRARQEFSVAAHLPSNLDLFHWVRRPSGDVRATGERLFFSAHYDDVVLSCGGLVHRVASQGERVRVVTVFAASDDCSGPTAFARHLHQKWGLIQPVLARQAEDYSALRRLGVDEVEHWDFLEAPYRSDATGRPLYCTYEELKGPLADTEQGLVENLVDRIETNLVRWNGEPMLYFPLGLGLHVDHQLLFAVGLRLRAAGHDVRFYEDFPYAESYQPAVQTGDWLSETVPISLEAKLSAAAEYRSQLSGLGNSVARLHSRLHRYATKVGVGRVQERYWYLAQSAACRFEPATASASPELPLVCEDKSLSLRDFCRALGGPHCHGLDTVLPVGEGLCVCLGNGAEDRNTIEKSGYQCLGIDFDREARSGDLAAAQDRTPLRIPAESGSAAAVVAWHVPDIDGYSGPIIEEAYRVLEAGGVFCGRLPCEKADAGATSPLAVEELLRKQGFRDVQVLPGLAATHLGSWARLRRWVGARTGALATPLRAVSRRPVAAARFMLGWAAWRLGVCSGRGIRQLKEETELESPSHVLFAARRPG
jgi:glycosyltransferase involved in cell wall biosynthesis/LmbE family N-acetylglucosaminyl deacetylase